MTVKELHEKLGSILAIAGDRHIEVIGQDDKGDRVRIRPFGELRSDYDNQGRPVAILR